MKTFFIASALVVIVWTQQALAVPDTVSARVTDVTTSTFSLVWMTDTAADPGMEIYADAGMTTPVTDGISLVPMPDAPQDVALAAKANGIMKIRVSGLSAGTRYYARTVTRATADQTSIGYSALQEVTTATATKPYAIAQDGSLQGFANDLASMKVYLRPSDNPNQPGKGDLLLLETPAAAYPLSAFVGAGTAAPEGVIDLNNLFGADMTSLWVKGGEQAQIRFYRGGALSTLLHYRRLPLNSGTVSALEPVKGFFADINLDGKVDDLDFAEFRKQYRTAPDDATYNPDYKFVQTPSGKIDAQDFARFAKEYGRTGVQ
jgi:hypothetical protein